MSFHRETDNNPRRMGPLPLGSFICMTFMWSIACIAGSATTKKVSTSQTNLQSTSKYTTQNTTQNATKNTNMMPSVNPSIANQSKHPCAFLNGTQLPTIISYFSLTDTIAPFLPPALNSITNSLPTCSTLLYIWLCNGIESVMSEVLSSLVMIPVTLLLQKWFTIPWVEDVTEEVVYTLILCFVTPVLHSCFIKANKSLLSSLIKYVYQPFVSSAHPFIKKATQNIINALRAHQELSNAFWSQLFRNIYQFIIEVNASLDGRIHETERAPDTHPQQNEHDSPIPTMLNAQFRDRSYAPRDRNMEPSVFVPPIRVTDHSTAQQPPMGTGVQHASRKEPSLLDSHVYGQISANRHQPQAVSLTVPQAQGASRNEPRVTNTLNSTSQPNATQQQQQQPRTPQQNSTQQQLRSQQPTSTQQQVRAQQQPRTQQHQQSTTQQPLIQEQSRTQRPPSTQQQPQPRTQQPTSTQQQSTTQQQPSIQQQPRAQQSPSTQPSSQPSAQQQPRTSQQNSTQQQPRTSQQPTLQSETEFEAHILNIDVTSQAHPTPRLVLSNRSTSTSSDDSNRSDSPGTPIFITRNTRGTTKSDDLPIFKPTWYDRRTNSMTAPPEDEDKPIKLRRVRTRETVWKMHDKIRTDKVKDIEKFQSQEEVLTYLVSTCLHAISQQGTTIREIVDSINSFYSILDLVNSSLDLAARKSLAAISCRSYCLEQVKREAENSVARLEYLMKMIPMKDTIDFDDLVITHKSIIIFQSSCKDLCFEEMVKTMNEMDSRKLNAEFKRSKVMHSELDDCRAYSNGIIQELKRLDINSSDFDCILVDKMTKLVKLAETFRALSTEFLNFSNCDILQIIRQVDIDVLQREVYNALREVVLDSPWEDFHYRLLLELKQHFRNKANPKWVF